MLNTMGFESFPKRSHLSHLHILTSVKDTLPLSDQSIFQPLFLNVKSVTLYQLKFEKLRNIVPRE